MKNSLCFTWLLCVLWINSANGATIFRETENSQKTTMCQRSVARGPLINTTDDVSAVPLGTRK